MSLKPPVYNSTQVSEQILELQQQKAQLETMTKQIAHKIQLLENSMAENDQLKKRVHELIEHSLGIFTVEWGRKSEFFPEIRLNMMQKGLELLAPPKK